MTDKTLFLIPLLPLLCGALNVLFGMRLPRQLSQAIAVGGVASSTVLTLVLWPLSAGAGTHVTLFTWLDSGTLHVPVEILFDPLSASMTLMVTGVSTLIHLYAIGYIVITSYSIHYTKLYEFFLCPGHGSHGPG